MKLIALSMMISLSVLSIAACSEDSNSSPGPVENAGSSCTAPSQCYPAIDAAAIKGSPVCIDKVSGGYCTHLCTGDNDCCAVEGECKSGHPQVCSPFESTGAMYCLLSCEDAQISASGAPDGNAYCNTYAHANFGCRSSGGGSKNRKICMP